MSSEVDNNSAPVFQQHTAADDAAAASAEILAKYHYEQELHRGLSALHLTAFGVNWMAPLGPAIIWGTLLVTTGGTVATPYFLAGFSMLFTAMAYAVMVPNFPLAGSAYSYISKGWNPYLGFMVGWVMIADYVFLPAITTTSTAYYTQQFFPQIPIWVIIAVFGTLTGVLNIIGVDIMAKMGLWLLLVGAMAVFGIYILSALGAANGMGFATLFTLEPIITFDNGFGALMTATTFAIFNYLGFDAITAMSEESNNPKKDVPRAIYLSLFIGALNMVLLGYLLQLPLGDTWKQFVNDTGWINTAMYQVAVMVGGELFGTLWYLGYLLNMFVFNVVCTAAASRLVYAMGRDDILPKAIFGKINKRFGTPHWNIVIIVALIFILSSNLGIDFIISIVNFGAISGFFLLNVNVIVMYFIKKNGLIDKYKPGTFVYVLRYLIVPIIGMIVIGWAWMNLGRNTLVFGACWSTAGLILLAVKTKGFRQLPPLLEI